MTLTDNQKRNARKRNKAERDHEFRMATMNAFAADPELKYWLGAGFGMGATWIAVLLEGGTPPDADPVDSADVVNWYESIIGAGSPLLSALGFLDFNKDGEGGLAGHIFSFGTASWTAFNITCLLLRNASGGEGGGIFSTLGGAVL